MSAASQVPRLTVWGSHVWWTPFAPLIPNRAHTELTFTKIRSLGVLVSGPSGLALCDKVTQYLETCVAWTMDNFLQINNEAWRNAGGYKQVWTWQVIWGEARSKSQWQYQWHLSLRLCAHSYNHPPGTLCCGQAPARFWAWPDWWAGVGS